MSFEKFDFIVLMLNLFNVLIFHNVFSTILGNNKKTEIERILAYAANFICSAIAYLCVDQLLLSILVVWITLSWISLTYMEKMKSNILSVTLLTVFIVIPNYIIDRIIEDKAQLICVIMTVRLLMYAISLLLYSFGRYKATKNMRDYSGFVMVLIPIFSLIAECLIIQQIGITIHFVMSTASVFAINFIAYYLYEALTAHYVKSSSIALLRRENELYSRQCEIMKESTEKIQSFRHDLNNQFIAMAELLSKNQIQEAKKQLQALSFQTQPKHIYSNTGNTAIDSIINYKFQNADKEHIKINTHIAVPADIRIDVADIITILGNLLDNAVDAVMLISEERFISLKLVYSQDRIIIRVANSYNGKAKNKDGHYATTKKDTSEHGFGMKNVEKATEKYNGLIKTDSSDNMFTVDLIMFLNS